MLNQLDAELPLWEVTEEEALKPERLGTDPIEAARKLSISVPAAPIVASNTNLAKAPGNRRSRLTLPSETNTLSSCRQ